MGVGRQSIPARMINESWPAGSEVKIRAQTRDSASSGITSKSFL